MTHVKIEPLVNITYLYIAKRKRSMDNISEIHTALPKEANTTFSCIYADSNRWQH